MNNQIQLVLKSSTTELSLNDHELGIYLTPELDGLTGLPEIRTTSGVNAGYDGGWTSAQNYDARSITIRGVIANGDVATVEQLRRQLTTLAGQGKNEELTLDLVTQAGKAYTIQVRTIALEMSLQKVLTQQEFMLQLRADDPLIYDASETGHEALLQVAQATGGFTIDFELPLAITGSSEETVVNNEGLEQVPTITRMYGALHNPKIINQTTNQFMQIEADLGFAEGDWIEPSEVVSGKDITINGAPEGAPLSSVQIDGETSQQTYTGYQLVTKDGFATPTSDTTFWNAVSPRISLTPLSNGWARFTQVESSSTIYGDMAIKWAGVYNLATDSDYTVIYEFKNVTATSGFYDIAQKNAADDPFASFTAVTGCSAAGGTNIRVSINGSNTFAVFVGHTKSSQTTDSVRTFTRPSFPQGKGFDVRVTYISGDHSSDWQNYCGDNWQPYTNGPAPNPDYPQAVQTVTGEQTIAINGTSYTVDLTSKNLFNIAGDLTYGGYPVSPTNNGDGTLTTTANYNSQRASGQKINCISGETYTVSGKLVSHTGTGNTSVVEILSGLIGGVTVVKREYITTDGSFSYSFVAPADVSKLWISFSSVGTNTQAVFGDIQIEAGSTATSFEPYWNYELCKIGTYQDYIYKSGGKWYLRKKIGKAVLDGSESWEIPNNWSYSLHKANSKISNMSLPRETLQMLCDYFTPSQLYNEVGSVGTGNSFINFNYDGTSSNLAGFKTWLANNNVSLYAPLVTPTDSEITNQTLIEQLEAVLAGGTQAGANTITLTPSAGATGTLEVEYYDSYDSYLWVNNRWEKFAHLG